MAVMSTAFEGSSLRETLFQSEVKPELRAAAFKVLSGSNAAAVVALDRALAWCARPAR